MRFFLIGFFLAGVLLFPLNNSHAENDDGCLCIASETVRKYCDREKSSVAKDEYRINQEALVRRDIRNLIDQGIEADIAKDAAARSSIETSDLTVKDLDGKTYQAAQIGASSNSYQGILRVSDDTRITIECLTLKGNQAVVYTNQHFVRYVPDRKDESPHEVITNIIHRETWVFTELGWKVKHIEELERGNTYLDRKLYSP